MPENPEEVCDFIGRQGIVKAQRKYHSSHATLYKLYEDIRGVNLKSKIIIEDEDEFLDDIKALSTAEIAEKYNMSETSVGRIAKRLFGKTYSELKYGNPGINTTEATTMRIMMSRHISEWKKEKAAAEIRRKANKYKKREPKVHKEAPHCGYIW